LKILIEQNTCTKEWNNREMPHIKIT